MCGEQSFIKSRRKTPAGSPPRVRGTDTSGKLKSQAERITPACAGNSKLIFALPGCVQDHPRVCGEQFSHCVSIPPS